MKQDFIPPNPNLQINADRYTIQQLLSDWAKARDVSLLALELTIRADKASVLCSVLCKEERGEVERADETSARCFELSRDNDAWLIVDEPQL